MKKRFYASFTLLFLAACASEQTSEPSRTAVSETTPKSVSSYQVTETDRSEIKEIEKQNAKADAKESTTSVPVTPLAAVKPIEEKTSVVTAVPKKSNFENYTIVQNVDLNEWKMLGNDEGVQSYQKKKELENGLVAFRAESVIPTSLTRIAAVFDDPSIRKDWIDSLAEAKVVKIENRLNRVEYNHTSVPWPFQDRDFLYSVDIKMSRNPNTMILRMRNTEDSAYPPKEGVVRGKLVYCYYYMTEVEPGKATKVAVEMSIDPMGNIPKWLVNASSKKWPQHTLSRLAKVAQRDSLNIPNDLENYYKTGGKQ